MILDEIVIDTKRRMEILQAEKPLALVKDAAIALPVTNPFAFEKALSAKGMSFICEVKRASPSKGLITEDFRYLEISNDYQAAGAAAISVLTEPNYFLGNDAYLQEISEQVSIPTLRKDFVIDPYQIYQAKLLGASAVLLICRILTLETLRDYLQIATNLGLSVLVEAHTESEVEMALTAGAKIIGVNNRDLQTFHVDLETSIKLRSLVPKDCLFVSESGIQTAADIQLLQSHQIDAVLIGEALMRQDNKKQYLQMLRGETHDEG